MRMYKTNTSKTAHEHDLCALSHELFCHSPELSSVARGAPWRAPFPLQPRHSLAHTRIHASRPIRRPRRTPCLLPCHHERVQTLGKSHGKQRGVGARLAGALLRPWSGVLYHCSGLQPPIHRAPPALAGTPLEHVMVASRMMMARAMELGGSGGTPLDLLRRALERGRQEAGLPSALPMTWQRLWQR